jgi:hypothetical protein
LAAASSLSAFLPPDIQLLLRLVFILTVVFWGTTHGQPQSLTFSHERVSTICGKT